MGSFSSQVSLHQAVVVSTFHAVLSSVTECILRLCAQPSVTE